MKTLVKMNFDPNIAKDVGERAAIIFENIAYWIDKNYQNQINRDKKPSYKDGDWWTYNSVSAFSNQFNWLTERQISLALKKLEEKNYIKVGNHNKHKYDRTNWYAIGSNALCQNHKSISHNGEMLNTLVLNANDTSVEPIPNYNTDYKSVCKKTTHTHQNSKKSLKDEVGRKTKASPQNQTIVEILEEIEPQINYLAYHHSVSVKEVRSAANRMASHYVSNGKNLGKPIERLFGWIQEDIDGGKIEQDENKFLMREIDRSAKQ